MAHLRRGIRVPNFDTKYYLINTPNLQFCSGAPAVKCSQLLNEAAIAAEKTPEIVYTLFNCPIQGSYKKGVYTMKPVEVNRFNKLYEHHLRLLKLQGKSQKTIDAYSRSVRRIREH